MTLEPMDKWRSSEDFERVGMDFKDALFNKGRVARMAKQAKKKAGRKARWRRSPIRKWIWRTVWFFVIFVVWGAIMSKLGWGT